jgi:Methionyl-tRNA formyltransferase
MTARVLPITLLAWEGPQARAYLARMKRDELRPERIVLMVRDPLGGKLRRVPGLDAGIPLRLSARAQDRAHNFHPYRIRRRSPELVAAIARGLAPLVSEPDALFFDMYDGFRYDDYADEVIRVGASSYKDPRLIKLLARIAPATVLFSGGGIVPQAVFDVNGLKLVHVHTGLLPYVRGADVLLWSLLVRGRPGVSAFVMTPGLDDGDVLATWETDPLTIDVSEGVRPDDETLYRAVFSFIDPVLRAELLVRDVLEPAPDARDLRATPQDLSEGITFHFMHPVVRGRALQQLFVSGRASAPRVESATAMLERYTPYYTKASPVAPLRFAADAIRTKPPLRALGVRNRQRDYAALQSHPGRLALHRALHEQLVLQSRQWDTYDYGEAYWYQSSTELGITGLRDTSARVDAFGLRDLVRGRSVLEIGSNSGFLSIAIANAAARVVAFEINPYLVRAGEIGAASLGIENIEFLVSSFEDFDDRGERFDDVLSFANHHTYDGNTHQGLEEYFDRCHAALAPGGRLIFESHPPALEGRDFARTVDIIERRFVIDRSEVHQYGSFLDRDRRFMVATRRELA